MSVSLEQEGNHTKKLILMTQFLELSAKKRPRNQIETKELSLLTLSGVASHCLADKKITKKIEMSLFHRKCLIKDKMRRVMPKSYHFCH